MNSLFNRIDHLVYAVPNLEKAMEELGGQLGQAFVYGGQHPKRGTHNALLRLGKAMYLELLAPDPSNLSVAPPRWMGVDLIDQAQLTRWALKSQNLEQEAQLLEQVQARLGQIQQGKRQRSTGQWLNWQLTIPTAAPRVTVLPFFIDWGDSRHPAESLEETCQLENLKVFHPKPKTLQQHWTKLGITVPIIAGEVEAFQATIRGPGGVVHLH